jgi:hypothetical protein
VSDYVPMSLEVCNENLAAFERSVVSVHEKLVNALEERKRAKRLEGVVELLIEGVETLVESVDLFFQGNDVLGSPVAAVEQVREVEGGVGEGAGESFREFGCERRTLEIVAALAHVRSLIAQAREVKRPSGRSDDG